MKNKSRLRYWLNLTTVTVLSLALTFLILVFHASNRWTQSFLHPARYIPAGNWLKQNNIPYQEIELTTADGVKLAAWYTPPKNGVPGWPKQYRLADVIRRCALWHRHSKAAGSFVATGPAAPTS